MSVEKYLENIRVPEVHPCPFSVRLKHNLRRSIYEKRRRVELTLKVTSSLGIVVSIFTIVMIYNPSLANNLHNNLLYKTGVVKTEAIDFEQLLAEKRQTEIELPLDQGIALGMKQNVSQGFEDGQAFQVNELSELPEEKPYIIRKVRDKNNRTIYLISDVNKRN
ncbi:MAG: hypothetical protein WC327_00230 [Candidatus Cloacimonadia bacterium]